MSSPNPALRPGPAGLLLRTLVVLYLAVLIVLPLAALATAGVADGPAGIWRAVAAPLAADALARTLWTAALMAAATAIMGTVTAWVLCRYRFPGRTLLATLVDLPFAIPTLVAGVMIVLLFGPQEPIGARLDARGFPVVFAPPGIVLALLFITLPFVVRAVEPVLLELDPEEEAAAQTLGAGPWTTFRRVLLPSLFPAIAYGTVQAFARGLAEFGSIVVVSGNIPFRTLTAPVQVFAEVEAGRTAAAAAFSLVLLALALGLALIARLLRRVTGAHA